MESIAVMMLCTGNPTHNTVASAVAKVFPNANFASRATGYDLTFWPEGSEAHFRAQIKNYNVFINSSFICNGGQLALLETTYDEWLKNNIKGHIINIGSTSEYIGVDDNRVSTVHGPYSIQKRALRDRSLQLNGKSGITTSHIIADGLNDGVPGHETWLDLIHVANTINWILNNPVNIPLLEIRAKK